MRHVRCEIVPFSVFGWNAKRMRENVTKFKTIFGTPLFRFMERYTGFDVIAFDQWIGPIDGRSCKELTFEQYGQDGLDLILDLMKGADRPDAIETSVDMDFDIQKSQSTTGFERCKYTFHLDDGGIMEGAGLYKNGLIVHREHHGYKPHAPLDQGKWQISSKDGVLIVYGLSFTQAKCQASAFGCAFDFERAQTITLTTEQFEAAKRVKLYFNSGGPGES